MVNFRKKLWKITSEYIRNGTVAFVLHVDDIQKDPGITQVTIYPPQFVELILDTMNGTFTVNAITAISTSEVLELCTNESF